MFPIHAIVWTLAAWLARGNLDIQGDMVENYVWGIEWQAGYAKHPPLFAWITAAWFALFPHTDIAYFALSALNAMAGLLGIAALASRFLPRRLAVLAGLAMAVSPLYSNLAIKFNANSVLLSVWPWTACCFVLFMQSGKRRYAVATGLLAGAAVLGKYFSAILLLALLLSALVRPAWRARLLERRALLAVLACAVTLTPHVYWLATRHFPTFAYAEERTGGTLPAAVARFGIYTLAQIAYLLPSFVFVALCIRVKRWQAIWQAMRQMITGLVKPSRYPDLWWLTFSPLLVTGLVAVLTKTQMASVWGMAQWFAITPLWLVLLAHGGYEVAPRRAARILAGYWLVALIAAAATGYLGALHATADASEPRRELAVAAHALWKQRTGQDIPIVSGSAHEAQSIAFYSSGHTRYRDMQTPTTTPWPGAADIRRTGVLYVCRDDDATCIATCAASGNAQPLSIEVRKHAWGRTLPAHRYWLFPVLPQTPGTISSVPENKFRPA